MSGFIVAHQPGAIHLSSDGGVFAGNGNLFMAAQKTYIFAQMPAAVTVAGSRAWGARLQADLCGCPSFDHFLDRAESTLKSYLPQVEQIAAAENSSTDFELIIAGYSSQRNQLACFALGKHQLPGHREPWKLSEIGQKR